MLQIAENHFVNGNKVKPPYPDNHERLVVGMGCFWGAERMFWQQEGVYSTSVGYSAGKTTDPTYNEVCSGVTDHAEVVLIVYDTETINLNSLLALITSGDNSIALYVKTGKEQEAPHYTLTQHSLGMSVMVARKEWWNNLTSEQQLAIESSWPDPINARLELREEEAENLKNAETMGIKVYRLSQDERELWKSATEGQAKRLAKEIGGRSEEILALVIQGKEDYQKLLIK